MKVLIVGGGGREHALAWKVAQSPKVRQVLVAPGNAGTLGEPGVVNVAIEVDDVDGLVALAQAEGVDLTLIGPEVPLVLGVVDAFRAAGLKIFGPTRRAAQLEGSKAFCKDFFARHAIPTAEYRVFTDANEARAWVRAKGAPIVVKADGLAAGKGVIVARSEDEACAAIDDMLSGNAFGPAGSRVVVEEFLVCEEASFIVMADGVHALALASSQDHKARDDGDQGPNTGGMGAYSPAPVVTPEVHERVMREVIEPTLRGMAAEGAPYSGFLYAGLMVAPDGTPKVLEFNCRFGDPETQPILLRLRSDLVDLALAAIEGKLDRVEAHWDPRAALGVVLAAEGYPFDYPVGEVISGLPDPANEPADAKVFHAGTRMEDGVVLTCGGRVLCATALGCDVREAQQRAYALVAGIHWTHCAFRSDIGFKALDRV